MLSTPTESHQLPASYGAVRPPRNTPTPGEDRRPEKLKDHQRQYRKRKASGLCVQGGCRAKAESGHTTCRKHLRQMSRRHRKRYRERSHEAACIYCGQRPGFWGVRCLICRQRFAKDPLPIGARRALRLYREVEKQCRIEQIQVAARLAVRKLLARGELNGNSAIAWRLYVGVDNGKWRTYHEVGQLMNLGKERVRQLLQPAKIRLARILGDDLPWKPVPEKRNFSSRQS